MNILLVEDEARVADFIQRGLRGERWLVTVVADGERALRLTETESFDLMLLDLMLPGMSGQEVCRRLRAKHNRLPIIMLTALGDVDDRIAGLRMGADDYLVKPFDFDELVARIDALVRRAAFGSAIHESAELLQEGSLALDLNSLEVRCGDQRIGLTPKERDILRLFLMSQGKVLSRERILSTVWGIAEDPQTNVVDVYVGRLRKKLGYCAKPIETVRGVGYRLRADPAPVTPHPPPTGTYPFTPRPPAKS